jgi:hypothetical protein
VAGFSDFAATFLGVWSILSSGLKPIFFFVYVPFWAKLWKKMEEKNFYSIFGKAHVDKYFRRFCGSEREIASFFLRDDAC